jgi:hypothetical protein
LALPAPPNDDLPSRACQQIQSEVDQSHPDEPHLPPLWWLRLSREFQCPVYVPYDADIDNANVIRHGCHNLSVDGSTEGMGQVR